jgi:hypothetical protein
LLLLLSAEVAAIAEIAAAGVQVKSLSTVIRTLPALAGWMFRMERYREAATAFDLRASFLSLRFQI